MLKRCFIYFQNTFCPLDFSVLLSFACCKEFAILVTSNFAEEKKKIFLQQSIKARWSSYNKRNTKHYFPLYKAKLFIKQMLILKEELYRYNIKGQIKMRVQSFTKTFYIPHKPNSMCISFKGVYFRLHE